MHAAPEARMCRALQTIQSSDQFWWCAQLHQEVTYSVSFSFNTEDPYPGSSIDLKCKEKVTDSDSENGSGDESERKVEL